MMWNRSFTVLLILHFLLASHIVSCGRDHHKNQNDDAPVEQEEEKLSEEKSLKHDIDSGDLEGKSNAEAKEEKLKVREGIPNWKLTAEPSDSIHYEIVVKKIFSTYVLLNITQIDRFTSTSNKRTPIGEFTLNQEGFQGDVSWSYASKTALGTKMAFSRDLESETCSITYDEVDYLWYAGRHFAAEGLACAFE